MKLIEKIDESVKLPFHEEQHWGNVKAIKGLKPW